MEEEKVYSILDLSSNETIFHHLEMTKALLSTDALEWPVYSTRYGKRHVNEIELNALESYTFSPLLTDLLKFANRTVKSGYMIPIQLFVCYYKDGNQVVPSHSHPCRQITLSLGEDRTMRIINKKGKKVDLTLYNGSVLYLHGQKHSIIKEKDIHKDRISFNLFFTTSEEQQGAR